MEVELDHSLLEATPRDDLTLVALCAFAQSGRHRIIPDDRTAWDEWLAELPLGLAEEVRFAWDESERRAAEGGMSERAEVLPASSGSWTTPIQLTPSEALVLLGRPLRVLLENGRNDRGFILAFADRSSRIALLRAEQEGWVVFETAGGKGELLKRLKDAPHTAAREVFRTIFLCDSDARQPRVFSGESTRVKEILENLSQKYARRPGYFGAVLSRRAAENYVPPSAVLDWACAAFGRGPASRIIRNAETAAGRQSLAANSGTPQSTKRRLLAAVALRQLHPDERGFIDMKEGRLRGTSVRTIDVVWNKLDSFQQAALLDGFGASFSADFYTERVGLLDETGEITTLLATIGERL